MYLLAFPRPSAPDGPRDFLLYVSTPARDGTIALASEGGRGFLIQAVGTLAGKATFAEGSVRVRPLWFAPEWRRLELNVRCDDQTEIRGGALVKHVPAELRSLQRRYAADIALLETATTAPADASAPTEPRPTAAP